MGRALLSSGEGRVESPDRVTLLFYFFLLLLILR